MKRRDLNDAVRQRDSEKGIVLIVVIIILSVLTILVVDLIYFIRIDMEISSNTRDEIKARYIAKSGVHIAAGTLRQRAPEGIIDINTALGRGSGSSDDGYWTIEVPFFPVGNGGASIKVTDERSKINLNALVSRDSNAIDWQVLIELRELFRYLNIDQGKSERFIASLVNWLDAPLENAINDQYPEGAQAGFYLSLESPYSIKDGKLDSVQEIRLIDGMDDELFNKIKRYVTIYPNNKKINFSTASRPVIIAAVKASAAPAIRPQDAFNVNEVSDDVAERIAKGVIEARKDDPIITLNKAREIANDVEPAAQISAGLAGVAHSSGQSETFTVRSIGSLGVYAPTKSIIEAILKKTKSNKRTVVDIIAWRES